MRPLLFVTYAEMDVAHTKSSDAPNSRHCFKEHGCSQVVLWADNAWLVCYAKQHDLASHPIRLGAQGVGPNLVTELCELASVDPALPPEQLQQEDWDSLYAQWRGWLLTISRGTFAAHLNRETGRISVLSAESAARSEPEGAPVGSVHELLDDALRSTEVHQLVLLS